MDIRDLSNFIRKIPLFTIYSDDELTELMQSAELKSINAGELIFKQGEPGETFYIVYSGKIRILQKIDEKEVNLGVRSSGDHFGETALILEDTRNASARAVEDSVLIVIGRDAFDNYFFARPELRQYFDKFIKYTWIHQFLKSCTDLTVASPKDLQELTKNFNSEFYQKGDVVFRQGADPDKFYLIERGKLKVVRWEDKEQNIINFLREGDFFGEKAFIEDTKRYADVICLTDCHLFSLRKEDFNNLVKKSPKIKKVIQERIESYLTDKPPIPYRDIIRQELSALKGISVQKEVPEDEIAPPKEKRDI